MKSWTAFLLLMATNAWQMRNSPRCGLTTSVHRAVLHLVLFEDGKCVSSGTGPVLERLER